MFWLGSIKIKARNCDSAEPKPIPLRELVAQRRARADRMEQEAIESGKIDPVTGFWNDSGSFSDSGNGSDEPLTAARNKRTQELG